jgi:pimeloyl-ACP methyl ester carboxylesterase
MACGGSTNYCMAAGTEEFKGFLSIESLEGRWLVRCWGVWFVLPTKVIPLNSSAIMSMVSLIVLAAVLATTPHEIRTVVLAGGRFECARAKSLTADAPAPLIVVLHGTDTTSRDMIEFWLSLDFVLPATIVAPQSSGTGWNDGDLPFLRDFMEHVGQTISYDSSRVLLAGHSAGGAMAMHLAYSGEMAVSAVAVTACYVPPTITDGMIRRHRELPLFYAVGQHDENRPLLRSGVKRLQSGGARVAVFTPSIGHVLDRTTTQRGLKWFDNVCRKQVESVLSRSRARPARGQSVRGQMMGRLEDVIRHADCHFEDQVRRARALLGRGAVDVGSESVEAESDDATRANQNHWVGPTTNPKRRTNPEK